jgi:hypothetical protein
MDRLTGNDFALRHGLHGIQGFPPAGLLLFLALDVLFKRLVDNPTLGPLCFASDGFKALFDLRLKPDSSDGHKVILRIDEYIVLQCIQSGKLQARGVKFGSLTESIKAIGHLCL